ncbi:TPA: hypothetical protein ACH3X2_013579 [Trebouxia sp. C0005]
MSVSALLPRHIFGLRGDVKDNIHFVEENTIIYPVGHTVVSYNVETKVQRFTPGSPESEGITALAVSPNKKFLAVAERSDKGTISVYDLQTLKRRKVLVSSETGAKEIASMAFSPDGRLLAAQGGSPEWNLVLWVWEKSKVVTSVKTTNATGNPVYQCLFNPGAAGEGNGIISVIGSGIFKCFKTAENSLKLLTSALAKREPQNYMAHCWLSEGERERMVLGTDSGELLIIEGTELKATLQLDPGSTVLSIAAYSKGFMVGSDGGTLFLFERDGEGAARTYRKTKTLVVQGQPVKIRNLAVSPTEDTLLCTLENNQMYSLNLTNTELMKQDEMNFELVTQSFHSSEILSIDACVRKPIVASVSSDHTVRLWNFLDKSTELVKNFTEDAYSVSLHPSGLIVLLGFADKLRLMTVLMDDFRLIKEFSMKACKECRFSHGGHYFAAVNGNTISIYNTYTFENVGNLRGHNGKVRSLAWLPDDTKLVSAGVDGAVYEWRLKDFKRSKENVLKGCSYSCVVTTPDSHALYVVGSDKKLKELEEVGGTGTQVTKELDTGTMVSSIALPAGGRVLFAGTDTGCIRAYKYPLNGEFQEFRCCGSAITQLMLTYDDAVLFASGQDGSLFVFDVKDKDPTRVVTKRESDGMSYAEEVLVTKSELEEKKQRMSELETQVNELTMQNEYQLRLKDLAMNEKVKELTEKFTAELDVDKTKFDTLLQEKNEQELDYEEKMKQFEEKHQAQLTTLDGQYQAKIMAEVERYQALTRERDLLNSKWDEQNTLLVQSHERVIQDLTEEYEQKLQEEQVNLEQLQGERDEMEKEFEEIKRQLEEDTDKEIEEMKERYGSKLNFEKELGLRLKGENGIMKKKFSALQKDIEDQREEIRTMFAHKKELYQTISSLEKDIAGLKKEIGERDETIGDKEKRIYDLKKKNQELEKFKFVLDYKIKELKKQIEPKEEQITDMKDQVKEMDSELERYHKSCAALELNVGEGSLKQAGLHKELARQRAQTQDAHQAIRRFQRDLQGAVEFIQAPGPLKEAVKKLYRTHCKATLDTASIEEQVLSEYDRQREFLEKNVDTLKHKLRAEVHKHKAENSKAMLENVALIREINDLRREIKNLKHAEKSGAGIGAAWGGSKAPRRSTKEAKEALPPPPGAQGLGDSSDELRAEIDSLRSDVALLKSELAARNLRIVEMGHQVAPRPMSRERPAMEGFNQALMPEMSSQSEVMST